MSVELGEGLGESGKLREGSQEDEVEVRENMAVDVLTDSEEFDPVELARYNKEGERLWNVFQLRMSCRE